jgi:sterol desaturase/sphingolipid hydroxylase (fatty acid hydroxylase superfamily)
MFFYYALKTAMSAYSDFYHSIRTVIEVLHNISPYSYLNAFVIFFGYIVQSSALQLWFYYLKNPSNVSSWKTQHRVGIRHLGVIWTIPILSKKKPDRANDHVFLATLNLVNASLFAFFVTEICMRGRSKMDFSSAKDYRITFILRDFTLAVIYENLAEYYWHRFLHSKMMYKRFHKYHHFIKSPEPWDDMYIHPLEAVIYYTILYAPPFLFRCHYLSFLLYMVVMGLCGTLDHSGIKFCVPGV